LKKKCYIYTRVSTAVQVEGYSLEAQKGELFKYAQYHELDIVGEYCDAGISGGSIRGRHDFQHMMNDVVNEKDSVSYILVFKLSRFGRNAADVLKSVQLLQDYGVDLVCVNDGIDSSTSGGRLMLSVLSAVAEVEKENIAVQFRTGRLHKFKNGGWAGSPVPYGYKNEGGKLFVIEEEAKVVKKIFEMYSEEENGISTIVGYLNDNNYKTRRGRPFSRNSVASIIKNPIYCGDMYFNRRTNLKNVKPKEILYAKGYHEPIISEDLYYRVKDKFDDKSKIVNRIEDEERISIMSGLVKCPLCGVGLVAIYSRKKSAVTGKWGKTTYGYCCPNHRKENGRTCSNGKQLKQELIDAAVLEYIGRVKSLSSFRTYMEEQLVNADEYDRVDSEIQVLRKKFYRTESKKDKVNKAIDALDVLSDDYETEFSDLSKQVDSLYDELDILDEEISKLKKYRGCMKSSRLTLEKINTYLEQFSDIYERMSCREKREMMRLLIERIDVFPERRDDGKIIKSITFRFPMYKLDKHGNAIRTLDKTVGYKMRCDNIGRTTSESKATYAQIKQYVWDMHQVKVNNLYIAQIKRKNGLIERKNYHVTKKGDSFRQTICPQHKEDYIVEALKHFKMIGNEGKQQNG
jgi:site-specific DNA recombinase